MMDTGRIEAFVAVAEAGSFAGAARAAGVAPSSVTRAVAALEADLGVRLLNRTTRRVTLTEAGESYLARVTPALEELTAADDAARSVSQHPAGLLRVAASVTYGQIVLMPRLAEFHATYPDIRVELSLADSKADLVAERIDVAIRHGAMADSSHIVRRLHWVRYVLVAAPSFLSRTMIEEPEVISEHALAFSFAPFRASWTFDKDGEAQTVDLTPRFVSNNALALRSAALDGLGVALLADWTVQADLAAGRLVPVLSDWSVRATGAATDPGVWLVTLSRAFVPQKVDAFARWLRDQR
ncbi:LysR family transcriptional regulator [Parvularcula maris]|uniref:LysR substrate-binding domain-containing protein n=1 Tax=Parvularcula maris TaxID=2965077 RepID=A0A9X2LBI0_9PROT|nr:LysR family transcriptional regulator [Parvularcula maris]MCQ8186635.1 LysR substrate-binding domain-containing protein [Parvularcula maris]